MDETSQLFDTELGGWSPNLAATPATSPPESLPPCDPPLAGLVHHWKGDVGGRDTQGNANLLPTGSLSLKPAFRGQGFAFTIGEGSVAPESPGPSPIRDTFTLEFWALPSADLVLPTQTIEGTPGTSGQRYAIAPEHSGTADLVGAGVSVGRNGICVFEHGSGLLYSPLAYPAQLHDWTHVVVVYRNRHASLYVNGVLRKEGLSTNRRVFPSRTLGNVFRYGQYLGLLDEVRIYDRSLTAGEIRVLASAGRAFCTDTEVLPVIRNGTFESGTLEGWEAWGDHGGAAALVREGSCFSIFDSGGIPFSGNFAVNVRSRPPDQTISVGILTSDPFVAATGIRFSALSEVGGSVTTSPPVHFETQLLTADGTLLSSQVVTTAVVRLPWGCVTGHTNSYGASYSRHFIDTSACRGMAIRVRFRQHTRTDGAGWFTLVDDVEAVSDSPTILVLNGGGSLLPGAKFLENILSTSGYLTLVRPLGPGHIAAAFATNNAISQVWIVNDGRYGNTGSPAEPNRDFSEQDRQSLMRFAAVHTNVVMDALAWRDHSSLSATNLTLNIATNLALRGGGTVLGGRDASGAALVQHANQVAAWLGFGQWSGIYETASDHFVTSGALASTPNPVELPKALRPTGTYCDLPHGLQPNGRTLFTAVFGTESEPWQNVDSPPLPDAIFEGRVFPQVNHLITTTMPGLGSVVESAGRPTNSPPEIGPIPDLVLLEDGPTGEVSIALSNPADGTTRFRVGAKSLNDALLPPTGLAIGGSGSNRSLTITPAPNQFGVGTIIVSATNDAGATTARAFTVTVRPVNDPPTLDPLSDQTVPEDAPPQVLALTGIGTGAANEVQTLRVTARSRHPEIIPAPQVTYSSPQGTALLTFQPTTNTSGTAVIDITVEDAGGTENGGRDNFTRTFSIQVIPVNDPPTVTLSSPISGQIFQSAIDIPLTAATSDPDGRVVRVEFFDESTSLGIATEPPFVWRWQQAPPGPHTITALATDDEGATTRSSPVSFTVELVDPQATVAIVGLGDMVEVRRQQNYLLAMDLHSQVFAPDQTHWVTNEHYRLAIWSEAGRTHVTSDEVAALDRWRATGRPLYFIGKRLASMAQGLPSADRALWADLTLLVSHPGRRGAGSMELLPEYLRYFGSVPLTTAYAPADGYEEVEALARGQVLGQAGENDVLVAIPRAGEPDLPTGYRGMSQDLWVVGEDESPAQAERQVLFQSVVCWLLRCNRCAAFNLVFQNDPTGFEARTGEEVELPLGLYQRYECVSTGVELTLEMPEGMEWEGLTSPKAVAYLTERRVRVIVGQIGATEQLALGLRVRPLMPTRTTLTVRLRSNESADGVVEGERNYVISATGEPVTPPPRLAVERTEGNIVVSWPAIAGSSWSLEASPRLGPTAIWTRVPGSPAEVGARFRQTVTLSDPSRFFRLTRP